MNICGGFGHRKEETASSA